MFGQTMSITLAGAIETIVNGSPREDNNPAAWTFFLVEDDDNVGPLTPTFASVPEPETAGLVALGASLLLMTLRRRRPA